MNLLIHNATILTVHNRRIIHEGAIAIEAETIIDVGRTHELKRKYGTGYERIDAAGKLVIPGLINTHQHAAMSLLRGYADDLPLQEWLEKWIWPVEAHMTPSDVYTGALLTAVESVMGGTTTVNTMYHYAPDRNEAKAFADAGLRGVVGHVCFSWRREEDREALNDLVRSWHNKADGTIRTSVDPHAPYTVSPEYMKELKEIRTELNQKYGSDTAPVIEHIHIAETSDEPEKIRKAFKIRPVEGVMKYLESLGTLDEHVIAAHCVALTDKDLETMKRRRVKASHTPVSNLKLSSGVSPVPEMLRRGITVSLGTDSPCSNNSTDMFQTMKTAALVHKGMNKDPTLMPAKQVLEMATIEGAKALSWENEIGSIETGKKADLVIMDFRKPHLSPLYNEASHLIYAAKASDVETVLVNGKIIMEEGEMKTLNIERVMDAVEKTQASLLDRLNTSVK